jgi:glutathione peroxidase-family protein
MSDETTDIVQANLQTFRQVVVLKSDVPHGCEFCGSLDRSDDFEEVMNHYLGHGFKILHVGSETSRNELGLCHVIAILGSEKEITQMERTVIPVGIPIRTPQDIES